MLVRKPWLQSISVRQKQLTVAKMREHVRLICKAYGIKRRWCRHADLARVEGGGGRVTTIWLPPIRGVVEYAAALHELGHVFGPYQSSRYQVIVRERWAWTWARKAAYAWTPAMERQALSAFVSYLSLSQLDALERKLGLES